MHTKTAVLNRLGSLLVLTRDVNSTSRRVVFQILNDCCQHVCQRKQSPYKHDGGEGYRAQNLGKAVSIFMVTLDAASSFVLFHAAWSLKLLRMMLPPRVGNFAVKKFSLPDGFFEIFNTKIYNMKICNTNIFWFMVHRQYPSPDCSSLHEIAGDFVSMEIT